jgi:hypothetical protein
VHTLSWPIGPITGIFLEKAGICKIRHSTWCSVGSSILSGFVALSSPGIGDNPAEEGRDRAVADTENDMPVEKNEDGYEVLSAGDDPA